MSTKSSGLFGQPEVIDWTGRSLAFIRQVTGRPAQYQSAAAAADASELHTDTEPPMGSYCWYGQNPYGNVSLALGGPACLCIGYGGKPTVIGYRSPILGEYLGWSSEIGPMGGTDEVSSVPRPDHADHDRA